MELIGFCGIVTKKNNNGGRSPSVNLHLENGDDSRIHPDLISKIFPSFTAVPDLLALINSTPIYRKHELPDFSVLIIEIWMNISTSEVNHTTTLGELLLRVCSDDWSVYSLPAETFLERCCTPKLYYNINDVYHAVSVPQYKSITKDSFPTSQSFVAIFPDEILTGILISLDAFSLYQSSCTCSVLRNLAVSILPGLKLSLFPHQFTSVWWMAGREAAGMNRTPHPLYHTHRTRSNTPIFVHKQHLTCTLAPPPAELLYRDVCGGLLCDEPGLGKTVTMLAVILRSPASWNRNRDTSVAFNQTNHKDTAAAPFSSPNPHRRGGGVVLRRQSLEQRMRSLASLQSCGTLIIVPDVLLPHWKSQIFCHTNLPSDDSFGGVFFDERRLKPLPEPEELATYGIVVIPHSRLSQEWQHRRPQFSGSRSKPTYVEEFYPDTRHQEKRQRNSMSRDVNHDVEADSEFDPVSPLSRIHWLRLVVDEGHSMGKGKGTSVTAMACSLQADRRWILTGTPLPTADTSLTLRYLFDILRFLRYEPYSKSDGRLWRQLVAGPVSRGELQGFRALADILRQVMVRHSKEEIATIPKPVRETVPLCMNADELRAYNAVAALARSNIVVTEGDYDVRKRNGGHEDSLLNPDNRHYLYETLRNLRQVFCHLLDQKDSEAPSGANAAVVMDAIMNNGPFPDTPERETLDLLRNECGATPDVMVRVYQYLTDVVQGLERPCDMCRTRLSILLLSPCGHLLCPDCLEDSGDCCRACGLGFDWNLFQKLQPGFEASNFVFEDPAILHLRDGGMANGGIPALSSKSVFLLQKVKELEDLYISESKKARSSALQHRSSAFSEHEVSIAKKTRFADDVNSNGLSAGRMLPDATVGRIGAVRAPKVVVFSQFTEYLHRLQIDLDTKGIRYELFLGKSHVKALTRFRIHGSVHVLLLSREGSLGIDLSFATHLFLMDTILDNELEQQVVSRIYRMGCTQSPRVFQLYMKDTLEEDILQLRLNDLQARSQELSQALPSHGKGNQLDRGKEGKKSADPKLGSDTESSEEGDRYDDNNSANEDSVLNESLLSSDLPLSLTPGTSSGYSTGTTSAHSSTKSAKRKGRAGGGKRGSRKGAGRSLALLKKRRQMGETQDLPRMHWLLLRLRIIRSQAKS